MDRITRTELEDKDILEVNYCDLKEAGMIELLERVEQLILQNKKPVVIVNHFNNKNYVTPKFLLRGKEITKNVLHYVEKMAFTGLSATQKILLMGFNIAMQRNFKNFESREEALRFLLDKDSTDKDLPDYFRK